MNDDSHFIQSIYELMALIDIDPSRVKPNYTHESGDGRIVLALPDSKVGIRTEGDNAEPFIEDDWFIVHVSVSQMQTFHEMYKPMMSLSYQDISRRSTDTTKKTSQHEQWLFDAIIRRGLPEPDRNLVLRKEDGKELTTPDFAWERIKVAFFVDGLWWHVTKDDRETLDALTREEHREGILESNRTRNERDGEIRSKMQADGWKILSCTDRQLEGGFHAIEEQVDLIEQLIRRSEKEYKMLQDSLSNSGNAQRNIEDLL